MKKKIYESPTVTKVEFDVKDLVAAAKCKFEAAFLAEASDGNCKEQ